MMNELSPKIIDLTVGRVVMNDLSFNLWTHAGSFVMNDLSFKTITLAVLRPNLLVQRVVARSKGCRSFKRLTIHRSSPAQPRQNPLE